MATKTAESSNNLTTLRSGYKLHDDVELGHMVDRKSTATTSTSTAVTQTIPHLPPVHLMDDAGVKMKAYQLQQNENWSTNPGISEHTSMKSEIHNQ